MPLSALLGHGDKAMVGISGGPAALRAEDVSLVGLRDLDLPERQHIKKWGLSAFTMRALDERGLRNVLEEAIGVITKPFDPMKLADEVSSLWESRDG